MPYILTSIRNDKTFMMTSYDPKTFVIFEKPVKSVDSQGNVIVYYSHIQLLKM